MRNCLLVSVTLGCALGCGDNSQECGPGTVDEDGVCVPAANCGFGTTRDEETGECVPDGSIVCSDGTVFNALTGRCEIDPDSCRDGTVLINNACVDPTNGLVIDLQEGPEPNGLDIIEASPAQAGNIVLKPQGTPFVVHGTLDPWRDTNNDTLLDPDVDTYLVGVAGPTLLQMTSDGVHGITAGFVAVAQVPTSDPLASWKRWGTKLTGDASRRRLYLPKAGTYRVAVADVRTLSEYLSDGTATAAPGGDDGDYFLSLTDVGVPTITTLPANTIAGTVDGNALQFFQSAPGTGITQATLAMPSDLAVASVIVMVNGTLRAFSDETSQPARVMTGGLSTGDTTFVVVDWTFDISPSPTMYTLSVNTQNL